MHDRPSEFHETLTDTIQGMAIVLAVVACLFLLSSGAMGQQPNFGNSQPPDVPEPRFKQLPDDPAKERIKRALEEKTDTTTGAKVVEKVDEKEHVGRIQLIKDRRIKFQHNDKEEAENVYVPKEAKVTLNRDSASLEDLKVGDFIRVTMSTAAKGTAARVEAARVVKTTEPNKGTARTDRVKTSKTFTDRDGGLGVVISDSPNEGVLILDARKDTPAEAAKIQVGDYLMRVDGDVVQTSEQALKLIRSHKPGETVKLTIWRDGNTRTGSVKFTTARVAQDQEAADNRPDLLGATRIIGEEPAGVETEVIVPREYDKLAVEYRTLHSRVRQLERELSRLKTRK